MTLRTQRIVFHCFAAVCLVLVAWLCRNFEWTIVRKALPFLLRGLIVSWLLTIISATLGLIAGTVLALCRTKGPFGVRHAATAFIEIVRAIPPLTIIFLTFFGVPALTGRNVSPWTAGYCSLTIIAAAYLAEVVRAGLISVPIVQIESAMATGLSSLQTMLTIVMPQALRNMIPALIAHLIMIFKTTSLVYVIGLIDFYRAIQLVNNRDFAPYALYSTMAVGYFLCSYVLSLLVRRLDPKYSLL